MGNHSALILLVIYIIIKTDLWNMNKYYKYKNGPGVTLIELVFVLAIFSIIIAITVSIFISIIQQQKKILVEQELLNQINYVVEYIGRQSRMAILDTTGSCLGNSFMTYNYLLTHYDASTSFYQGIKFISDDNNCYEFFIDTDGILKEIKNASTSQNILSDKFKIKYARFIINGDKTLQGAPQNNSVQPRITFLLNIQIQTSAGLKEEIFQTTISQRYLKQF